MFFNLIQIDFDFLLNINKKMLESRKFFKTLPMKTIVIFIHLFSLSVAISSFLSRNLFIISYQEYDIKVHFGMFEICLEENCIPYQNMISIFLFLIEYIKIWIGISILIVLWIFVTLLINLLNSMVHLFEVNLWIFDVVSCKLLI